MIDQAERIKLRVIMQRMNVLLHEVKPTGVRQEMARLVGEVMEVTDQATFFDVAGPDFRDHDGHEADPPERPKSGARKRKR